MSSHRIKNKIQTSIYYMDQWDFANKSGDTLSVWIGDIYDAVNKQKIGKEDKT